MTIGETPFASASIAPTYSPGLFFNPEENRTRQCGWAAKNISEWCQISNAKTHCPKTCGDCSDKPSTMPGDTTSDSPTYAYEKLCVDFSKKFFIPKQNGNRKCSWAANKDTENK